MNETRKTAAQSLLETGTLVLFRVVDTHTELSPDKENVFVRAELAFEDDDEDTDTAEGDDPPKRERYAHNLGPRPERLALAGPAARQEADRSRPRARLI